MRTWVRSVVALGAALTIGQATAQAQTLSTEQVMLAKLGHTQHIVEALMKGEPDAIAREAEALSRLTQQPGWTVLTTPEYVHYSEAFLHATSDLAASARDGNLDGSALHYAALVIACYSCHRYVNSVRITQIDDGDGEDGQRPPARPPAPPARPPVRPSPAPAPSHPPSHPPRPAPSHPGGHGHGEVYGYPLIFQPDFMYRFPYGAYAYYEWGYPYPTYGYPPFVYPFVGADVTAEASAAYGTVQFDVAPRDARIVVDGYYAGTIAELDDGRLLLVPGPHHIELQADRYETAIVDVHIQPSHTIKYRAALKPDGSER